MERREDEAGRELCLLCGEEVDLMDPSAHALVEGRTLCRECAHRTGGKYDPEQEVWTHPPRVPESLEPLEDEQ